MKRNRTKFATTMAGLLFVLLGTVRLHAQISNEIRAHIDHSFVIGNATLPPGEYTFQMAENSNLSLMTVTNANDKTAVEFIVRASMDNHVPSHTEITFRKYGNVEFLSRIYQGGVRTGVAVTETSREEDRMIKQGQNGMEHTEEQQQ